MPEQIGRIHSMLRHFRSELRYLRLENYHGILARWSRRRGVTKPRRNPELIVSLTSIPERWGTLHLCLDSLLRQSTRPDRLILWLGLPSNKENNQVCQSLPGTLEKLKERGLEIRWCRDTRSFKKIIPALRAYPDALIVTADDDFLYPRNWLKELFEAYKREPHYIHCHRAHLMRYDAEGKLLPYREWSYCSPDVRGPSLDLFPTEGGGVLYAPGHLHSEVLNENAFESLCPSADDVWLKAMSLLNHVPCKKIRSSCYGFEPIRIPNNRDLQSANVAGGGNDSQIEAVRQRYGTFRRPAGRTLPEANEIRTRSGDVCLRRAY